MTPQDRSWFTKPMPNGWLVFGVFLLFLGVVYTCLGKSYNRFHGWVYRSKEPKEFWWSVATYYLGGGFLIGADVFNVPADFLIGVLFIFVHWGLRIHRLFADPLGDSPKTIARQGSTQPAINIETWLTHLSETDPLPKIPIGFRPVFFYFSSRIRSCRNCRSGSCWVRARAFS